MPSPGVFDQSFLDLVARWVILTAMFLSLTYFFRDRVMPEGAVGFALSVFVLLPVNVFAGAYVSSMGVPAALVLLSYMVLVFVTNLVILEAFVFVLPGYAVSSQWALALFAVGLSAASALIRYIPDMADLVPPGITQ